MGRDHRPLITKMSNDDGEEVTVTEFPDRFTVSNRHGQVVQSGPTGDGHGAVGAVINLRDQGYDETSCERGAPPFGTV